LRTFGSNFVLKLLVLVAGVTKNCHYWHILATNVWLIKQNSLPLHYEKVPTVAGFRNNMKEIKRDRYLKQPIDSRQNGFIKVVTGIRRCGKSYLLNV
jgi:hypothetical protein